MRQWLIALALALTTVAVSHAQTLRVESFTLPATATTVDVTWSGAGTPDGVLVFGGYATANDTTTADAGLSCGMSDFSQVAAHHVNAEDDQGTTDANTAHVEDAVHLITTPGLNSELATLTVATITDGVRFTRGESGTQYIAMAVGVFADDFQVFSSGDTTTADSTFNIAHSFGVSPEAGIYCYAQANESESAAARLSIGMHSGGASFEQAAFSFTFGNNDADGEEHAQVRNDRVGFVTNFGGGGESTGFELTTNGSSLVTFTARSGVASGDLVGGFFHLPTVDTDIILIDSPDATGAWAESGFAFEPGSIFGVINQMTTVNTAVTDNAAAGTASVFATDFTTERSASIMDENGVTPSDAASRLSTELWLGDDDQTESYACNGLSAESDGWSATCDSANGTTHLWPFLAFEQNDNIAVLYDYYLRDR